ncbi:MAG: hypothetical protein ACLS7W_02765 [Bifidobacterium longum]|jgi:hypothetical protein|uniref:hypothetical protein n=1 Tax=Bifidobacterium longum TaxID=216816 RepID=UPI0004D37285|nr:hypothetical protein [Bifidobacterium longum]KEY30355.1 hypothetical protein EK3BL_01770 [Bifidobacterium longum subsp. infantis EK3]WAT13366.1 hypothetical protein O0R44_05625 [Bifidobacterium longum subsp. infantis]
MPTEDSKQNIHTSGLFEPGADHSDRVLAMLQSRWSGDHKCPICGCEDWRVQSEFEIESGRVRGGNGDETFISLPLVPVMCGHCGYTFFMNSMRMTVANLVTVEDSDTDGEHGR